MQAQVEKKPRKPYQYQIAVGLDEEMKVRLWDYIKRTHVTTAGALAETVRQALKEFLDRHQND